MHNYFRTVMFNDHNLLLQADGTGGGGAPDADDQDDLDNSDDGQDEGNDTDEDDVDPLDQPMYSKRQIAQIISGRVNDVKKGYANYNELQEVATMISEIIGSPDINAVVGNIRDLHSQHRAKAGLPPKQAQFQQPDNTKRMATEAEFDNSFIKNPEYADADLFRDDIIEMAQNGFSLAQAYWAVAGPLTANKKAEAAARQATLVAQNKSKQNKHKQVTPGNAGSPGKTGKAVISQEVQANARKLGMDPEEYVAWSGVTTFDQAKALGKK